MKILFYGTPSFASHSLQSILSQGFNVVGVVTAPDKPAGRGLQLQMSEVKKVAIAYQIRVFQPTNLKSDSFKEILETLKPDIQVVIAFRMMPEQVWSFPPQGTFNLHASLLPQYRGAAPINHAIINGETQTGVTTFMIEKEIDTGKILLQKTVEIRTDDTAGTLHDKLMEAGSELVIQTLKGIEEGNLNPKAQIIKESDLKKAPKIFPPDCQINWNQDHETIYNFIRGLSPYPGARTSYLGKNYKIYQTQLSSQTQNLNPGEWLVQGKELFIGTQTFPLQIISLQPEGKKQMKASDFLLGFRG